MSGSRPWSLAYGCVALVAFGLLVVVASVLALVVPGLACRRRLIRALARFGLMLLGLRLVVRGTNHLPDGSCIVVANHASYLDGVILTAVLPPRFSFVIKREAASLPLAGLILRRIGSEFVDRGNPGGRQADARRVVRKAESGHSLVFFPEGTFVEEPGLRRFHLGAFVAATRSDLPLVPVVIRGARRSMPSGAIVPLCGHIEVDILEPLQPASTRHAAEELRRESRRQILARLEEPDLEHAPPATPQTATVA